MASSVPIKVTIVYGSERPVKVALSISPVTLVNMLAHKRQSLCSGAPFSGVDAAGTPFTVDVGTAAVAILREEREEDDNQPPSGH